MEYSNNTFLIHVCMTKCRWCNSVCKCILYEYYEYVCVCVCRWSCTYLQLQILTDVAFKSDLLQFFFLFMCVCPSVWSLAGCVSVRVSSSRNRCRNFYYCRHRCYLCMSVNKQTNIHEHQYTYSSCNNFIWESMGLCGGPSLFLG